MDPVCMMTCFPQLLSSFIYKPASLADTFKSFQGLANSVRFLIARDMIISEVRVVKGRHAARTHSEQQASSRAARSP